jgi:hypothetical protein
MLRRTGVTVAIILFASTATPAFAQSIVPITTTTTASTATTIAALEALVNLLTQELQALLAARGGAAVAVTAGSTSCGFTRTLAVGSKGTAVSNLQQVLKNDGYYTYPTITVAYAMAAPAFPPPAPLG